MKIKKKPKNQNQRAAPRLSGGSHNPAVLPFIEHAYELRRRLYYIIASIVLWGGAIYAVQQHVVNVLLRPAKGQHFIYTSPGGGIDFLFRVCVYGGIVLSLPVIVYNSLRFFEPLMKHASRRFVALGSLVSGILALAGTVFGYYVGLPAALHFLLHQFTTVQIQPLVTIQSYLAFVIVYMVGSAMLFQLPLLLLFINRVKPLNPRHLLHYERWVILVAFVLAGLMNPTPNIFSQLLVAGPFILMYQVGIGLIAFINRGRRPTTAQLLREQDMTAQESRLNRRAASSLLSEPSLMRNEPRQPGLRVANQSVRRPAQPGPRAVQRSAYLQPQRQAYAARREQARPFSDIRTSKTLRTPYEMA